jgi:hypothetical protein
MSKTELASKKPESKLSTSIPPWPFARRSETISRDEWPGVYKKIRDKVIKQLEKENEQAQLTIRDLLDQNDILRVGATSAEAKLVQIREIVKIV